MKREEKAATIEEIATQISQSEAIYAADYRGLTVTEAASLRANLREADATFRIVKNTLTLLAAEKAGAEQVKELVDGPTAFTFVSGDVALAAKALDGFTRQAPALEIRGGFMNGELLDADAFRRLARLPGRDQLHAQIAGMIASPITGLVRGVGSMISGLAIALGQVHEQKEAVAPAEAPAAEAPAPEEAPAETAAEEAPPEEQPEMQASEPESESTADGEGQPETVAEADNEKEEEAG